MNLFKRLTAVFIFLAAVGPVSAGSDDFYSHFKYSLLSVRKLTLEREEKIIGFKLKLKGAYIYSVPIIPHDWTINIANFAHTDDPWNSVAAGVAGHGSGAVKDDYFKQFIVIGAFKPIPEAPQAFPRFDLELEVTTEIDHLQRKVTLSPKDFIYTPYRMERGF